MKSYTIGFRKIRVDISKVRGNTGYTTCPECSASRKTLAKKKAKVLAINKTTGHYTCNHCDFKGRVDSNEWIETQHAKETGLKNNTPFTPHLPPKPKTTMKPFQTGQLSKQAIEYLNDRGISKETAKACKVAFHKGALCFNYYKEGKIVGAKYRLIDKKFFWQHVTPKKYLYGLNDIKDQETIIIVEGEFDKLAFYEAGIKNVCSVAQGAPNVDSDTTNKLQCLDNSIDYIKNAKRVILACDHDPNGQYLTKVLIERFGADRCATVEIPEGCKDANDVLVNLGKEAVKKLIDMAKDTPIAGVRTLNQAKDKMVNIYHNGVRKGIETGIRELKGSFSFYRGWLYLFHGIPNSGKSAFAHFLMMCMAVLHGWKWAVFSPEHYPEEDFYVDMIEILTGKNIEQNNPNRLTMQEYEVAMEFVNKHFFFVYPQADDMNNTLTNVLAKVKELKLSKGIDGYLIDPYNQLMREDNEQIARYIDKALAKISTLNKTHNLVGGIVAHPRTLYKEKDEPDYKKSTPYQIEGGAMWYNKCDVITNVHRKFNQSNKLDTSVEIDIQKVKSHKRAGRPKCVDMNYDRNTGWYISLMGTCALDGAFEHLLRLAGIEKDKQEQTELTFTEKMNLSPNGYDLTDCPF